MYPHIWYMCRSICFEIKYVLAWSLGQ